MRKRAIIAGLLAAAGAAAPATAQDSVSGSTGIANVDSIVAWDLAEQANYYVVDLQSITTSRENVFGIAPLFKAHRVWQDPFSPGIFPTCNISHNVVSNMTVQGPAPLQSYSLWTGPGMGVNTANPNVNLPGTPVSPSGQTFQLAAAMAEFGFTDGPSGTEWNGIVAGTIHYTAAEPTRLYVSRINAAANGRNNAEEFSQFGLGAIDASGNVYFRADNAGTPAAPNRIQGQNIFRVRLHDDGPLPGRDPSVANVIDDNVGGAGSLSDHAATDWIVQRSTITHSVPNAIPRERGLGVTRGVYAGPAFSTEYIYEFSPNATTGTGAHRGPFADHRSPMSLSHAVFFPGSVATMGVLLKNSGSPDVSQHLGVWGVAPNGAVVGTQQLALPTSITDNGVSPPYTQTFDLTIVPPDDPGYFFDVLDGFDHYRGQTAFRGGPTVGVGMDQAGRLIATGVAYIGRTGALYDAGSTTLANWGYNAITVARVASPGAQPEWTLAAYVVPNPNFNPLDPNPNNRNPIRGKPFVDENGTPLGELRPFFELVSTAIGPSLSAGAVDSVGNVWFIAPYDRYNASGDLRGNPTTGLFRAIYNPDNFSYTLELVLSNGAEIRGRNSDRDFKITFLSLTNSNGGVSPGGLWANSVNQSTWAGAHRDSLATEDPRTCGGVVLQASIIYDVNDDGEFISLTGNQGDPNSPDQNYNVLLFIGATQGGGQPVDCNGNGIDDAVEIAANPALDCYNPAVVQNPHVIGGPDGVLDMCQCQGNFNRDGAVNSTDISAMLAGWLDAVNNGNTNADINCSGSTNSTDISAFLTIWLAQVQDQVPFDGCP